MVSYSDLKIDSHYLIRACHLGDNERLDIRVCVWLHSALIASV